MAEGIETPCIGICRLDPVTDLCTGCHRTIAEIIGWGRMNAEERRAIMVALPVRARQPGNG